MSDEFRFWGRERVTIELDGTCDAAGVRVPAGLELELDERERACVRVFAFDVEGLRIVGVPLVRSSYAELLWRIAVRANDAPAWWVIACDLGPALPRMLARRLVRYPTRSQQVELTREHLRSTGAAGALSIQLRSANAPSVGASAPKTRPLLVGDHAQWVVPWGDDCDEASAVAVTVGEDSLSATTVGAPVVWSPTAWLRTGREHRCGVARRR